MQCSSGTPDVAPRKLRFVVSTTCELLGRTLTAGDVVVLDDQRRDILVATTLAHDPSAVLELLVGGHLAPVDASAADAHSQLAAHRPPTRVLMLPLGRKARTVL